MIELLINYVWFTQANNLCQNWYFTNQVKYEKFECSKLDTENIILNVKKWKN